MSEYKDNNGINEAGLPKVEKPVIEEATIGEPKIEEAKIEEPKMKMPPVIEVEASKVETPKVEVPNVETSNVETPKIEAPNIEASSVEDILRRKRSELNTTNMDMAPAPKTEESRATVPPVYASPVEKSAMAVPPIATPEAPKVDIPKVEPQPRVYDTYKFSQAKSEIKDVPKVAKKKSGIGRKFAMCIALALVFGLISGSVFLGVNALGRSYLGDAIDNGLTSIQEVTIPSVEETDIIVETAQPEGIQSEVKATGDVAGVAANVMPSVVSISNVSVQEVPDFFGSQKFESESSGSGIIVGQNDTELLVATNNHVVAGAQTITVTFIDMNSVEAQIKGTDADNDLAVVAVSIKDIEESTLEAIKVANIGDSDKLVVGEQVVAIGNALGYGQSVTAGYVSALDREVTVENVTANLIQTDAAINPGNSGGALLNMSGELIGINAVKFAANGVEGMGYAIPVSTAKPILDELMNRTTRFKVDEEKASYLGVTCRAITEDTAQMYNMPMGVFVAEVVSGTAAEKAGIKMGDIITKLGDTTIKTYNELVDALQYYEAGETVEMIIARAEAGEYKEQTISVTLDARPADLDSQNQQEGNPEGSQEDQGAPGEFRFPW